MRRGILLGSFDPIHIGHISMATAALNENLVDEVIFIPAYQNPWKTRSTDFDIRVMMTQLAVDDLENCKVSIVDYFNIEPYYTSNTLKLLKQQYPEDELCIIVGADTYVGIDNWHEGKWILNNFEFIVVNRPGYEHSIKSHINNSLYVSSTEIRKLIKEDKQVYPLVPTAVECYINEKNLYK